MIEKEQIMHIMHPLLHIRSKVRTILENQELVYLQIVLISLLGILRLETEFQIWVILIKYERALFITMDKYEKAWDTTKLKPVNDAILKARSKFISFATQTKKYQEIIQNHISKFQDDLEEFKNPLDQEVKKYSEDLNKNQSRNNFNSNTKDSNANNTKEKSRKSVKTIFGGRKTTVEDHIPDLISKNNFENLPSELNISKDNMGDITHVPNNN